ncbi:MAG: hypothetical protein ACI9S8_000872 [Chlamydiales bacterium]|jgi:hypothetical protein
MEFDIYCDESQPDLLASQHPQAQYLVIGSLWLKSEKRQSYKDAIHTLRNKHKIGGEFKWQKISPSRENFYNELIQWFVAQGDELRFRCIAVANNKVNLLQYHDNNQELGFYKFYYQMLHHWIADFNEYHIFCDYKTNQRRDRLHVLERCLDSSNLSAKISSVQATRSSESVLIQLTDVLTGIASSSLNQTLKIDSSKHKTVLELEKLLGKKVSPTSRNEYKFNVFQIDLSGGWQ